MATKLENFRFRYNGLELKASGLLNIDPGILQLGATLFFGVKNELPKEELEVKSGYDHSFISASNKSFEGAVKLRIDWVAWNSKVVLLIKRYETDAENLYNQLRGICDRTEFENRLEILKELPDDWKPSSKGIQTHPIRFIESVVNRLIDTETLIRNPIRPPILQSGLALFILCTCIESLGRNDEFIEYRDWLQDKKKLNEVKEAINDFHKKGIESERDLLLHVYQLYIARYGFLKTFRNFFHQRLNAEWRSKLGKKITVLVNDPKASEPKASSNIEDLIWFLEDFRNNFAHRFESSYNIPTQAQFPDPIETDPNEIKYVTRQIIFQSGKFKTVETTSDFLETLIQATKIGLWHWICEQSDTTARL